MTFAPWQHRWMWIFAIAISCLAFKVFSAPTPHGDLVVVVGAAGEDEFGEEFEKSARQLLEHGKAAGSRIISIGLDPIQGSSTAKEELQKAISQLSVHGTNREPVWLILLGHGTHDGKTARFNLEGPDVTSDELAKWLNPVVRPTCIVNSAPASAPFIRALSATNRIVITATRSGQERNATRFGTYFPRLLIDSRSDRDKDLRVSALEAFLATVAAVEEEYRTSGRLATEHALFDDNGDGVGTPASKFKGIRPVKSGTDQVLDGVQAHQLFFLPARDNQKLPEETLRQMAGLEAQIESLRNRKASYPSEETYLDELEALLLQLARLTQGNAFPATPVTPSPAPGPPAPSTPPATAPLPQDPIRKD